MKTNKIKRQETTPRSLFTNTYCGHPGVFSPTPAPCSLPHPRLTCRYKERSLQMWPRTNNNNAKQKHVHVLNEGKMTEHLGKYYQKYILPAAHIPTGSITC